MKILLKYTLLLSLISTMVASCAFKEDILTPDSGKKDGSTLIIASVEDFSRHNVSTKATDSDERKVNNLAMLVFATPNTGSGKVLITDPVYVEGEKLDFVINITNSNEGQYIANIQGDQRNSFRNFNGDLSSCRIYIVANINHLLEDTINLSSTEDEFLNIGDQLLSTAPQEGASNASINIPATGFPMIGWKDVDLRPESSLGGGSEEALTVSMKKLFAKINFKVLVKLDSNNIPGGMGMVKTPYFEPTEWSVHNVPMNYVLRDYTPSEKPVNEVFHTQNFTTFNFSTENSRINKRVEHSPSEEEFFEFSFYIPEYKVLPRNPITYPSGIEDNLKQCYKPTFCDTDPNGTNPQFPTYVVIKGKYSDHQGHISGVQYSLYLGQNEIDDFQILRNQALNNTAVIKGLTNHSQAGDNNISIDHRVNVTSSGYSIAMERETLLDSHFEFRPMDISVQEGAVVVVKLPQNTWFGAERADQPLSTNTDLYEAKGNRKYFTTTLINELGSTAAAKEFVFRATDNGDDKKDEVKFRLWFYFDENALSPYDASQVSSETNKLYREDKIWVDYYESEVKYSAGTPKEANREFTFRQMNLWSIKSSINDYGIEYFEEYLYNYAADDNYGITTDGMPWGLEKVELSSKTPAVYADKDKMGGWGEFFAGLFGGSNQDNFNDIFGTIDKKYDFYLTRDNMPKPRDYAGLEFTKGIVNQPLTNILDKTVTLSKNARSAVEYCYNKNKRNSEGLVEDIHWYLPSIDETEDILVAGFNYFSVFQSKYYWSSQPAYNKYSFTARQGNTSATGYFYEDDVLRARATIVTPEQTGADSGVEGTSGEYEITINEDEGTGTPNGPLGTSNQSPQIGNQKRSEINRVRCAYSKTPYPHIFGNYKVNLSTNAAGTSGKNTITVNISAYNTEINGVQYNVRLSNPLHPDYVNINYPQYAKFDKATQTLTIPMGQLMSDGSFLIFRSWEHYSILFNNGTAAVNQNLELVYNKENATFELKNSGDYIRYKDSQTSTTGRGTGYYFQSIVRDDSL